MGRDRLGERERDRGEEGRETETDRQKDKE